MWSFQIFLDQLSGSYVIHDENISQLCICGCMLQGWSIRCPMQCLFFWHSQWGCGGGEVVFTHIARHIARWTGGASLLTRFILISTLGRVLPTINDFWLIYYCILWRLWMLKPVWARKWRCDLRRTNAKTFSIYGYPWNITMNLNWYDKNVYRGATLLREWMPTIVNGCPHVLRTKASIRWLLQHILSNIKKQRSYLRMRREIPSRGWKRRTQLLLGHMRTHHT
jgi:hypothetical protein